MRILVISDIHANLMALEAVLAAAGTVDAVWCLGDTVGYGPNPNECVERLHDLPNLVCLIGNHDAAAIGNIDLNAFNREARISARWTQNVLNGPNCQFLKSLPERVIIEEITLAHGSPRSPVWEYLLDPATAAENLNHFHTNLCFIGHTHIPLVFHHQEQDNEMMGDLLRDGDTLEINNGRVFLNPGSVGQPRDHDPRAAFAIFNPETNVWQSHRVGYDIGTIQEQMRQAGLPARLINRLADGW